jgi:hypothetical protein
LRAGNHRRLRPFAPDFQLFDRGCPKGVSRGQHDLAAFRGKICRQFADRRSLAGAVDADNQNDERLLRCIDDQRFCDRRQHFFDLGGDHRLDLIGRNRLVVAAVTDSLGNARRDLGPEIGPEQHILDVLEHGAVEFALGHEVGDRRAKRTRRALQSAG